MGDFNNIFKRLRIAAGLTQEELAQKLGITRSRVGMYETGKREPDFETLELIADFFNVDIDYLLGRTSKTTLLPENVHSGNSGAFSAQPTYEEMVQVYTRSKKNLSPSEKMRLAKLILEDEDDE